MVGFSDHQGSAQPGRRGVRHNRQDIRRIGSKPRHPLFQCLQPRTRLSATPTMRWMASFLPPLPRKFQLIAFTSRARARSAGSLRDQLPRKPRPGRSTCRTGIAAVVDAILVNAPTLKGRNLLQGHAIAISRTTGIHALLFGGLSRRKRDRGEIGVTGIECSRAQ
jgi:hypothetical protein